MGEMAEFFAGLHERESVARAFRREKAPVILERLGIEFTSHNEGAHLILRHNGRTVHYWPGPNKWMELPNRKKKYTLKGLIKYITEEPKECQKQLKF